MWTLNLLLYFFFWHFYILRKLDKYIVISWIRHAEILKRIHGLGALLPMLIAQFNRCSLSFSSSFQFKNFLWADKTFDLNSTSQCPSLFRLYTFSHLSCLIVQRMENTMTRIFLTIFLEYYAFGRKGNPNFFSWGSIAVF